MSVYRGGIKELSEPVKYLRVKKLNYTKNGQSFNCFLHWIMKLIVLLILETMLLVEQNIVYKPSPEDFKKVALARTFCRLEDVNSMRAVGLALGGSLENAIVISQDEGIMNEEGLRCDDEFIRHKF